MISIIIIIAILYLYIGVLLAGIFCGYDNNNDDFAFTGFVTMLWPLVLLVLMGIGLFKLGNKLGKRIAKLIQSEAEVPILND